MKILIYISLFFLIPVFGFGAIPNIPTGRGLGFQQILAFIYEAGNHFYTVALALIAVVIVWSGIVYLTAGGDTAKTQKARKVLLNGVIGAIILFGIGSIIVVIRSFATDGSFLIIGGSGGAGGGGGAGGVGGSDITYGCDVSGSCVQMNGGIFAEPTCSNQCTVGGASTGNSCYDCTNQGSVWCLADSTCIANELDCQGVFTRLSGGCP